MMSGDVHPDDDPDDLVPGDPELVWEMSGTFDGIGMAFEDIAFGFRAIDFGDWEGAAAEAFHARFDDQPKRFLVAADAFVTAASALDTYASALSWAQGQASEAAAMVRDAGAAPEVVDRARPLTLLQQAEQAGVLGADSPPERAVTRAELRAAAADRLHRARAQLDRIGRAAAVKVRAASAFAPPRAEVWEALRPPEQQAVPRPGIQLRSIIRVTPVLHRPDVRLTRLINQNRWDAGVEELVRRVRRLGLDQLSPRLKQHIFEGHLKKRKHGTGYRDLGYHHREAGVDRGPMRVRKIFAGPDANGVYRAFVAGPRTEGGSELKKSTFFPDSWTRDEVLHAIRHAFVNRTYFDRRDPAKKHKWRGQYRGVTIEGYVERQCTEPPVDARSARLYHIVAAYPVYCREEVRGQDR